MTKWLIAVAAGVLGVTVWYGVVGSQPDVRLESNVECLSAEGTVGCVLDDGWNVSVPLDVSWVGRDGSFRSQGRPECLPPTGRGLEGPVELAWVPVEVDGMSWRQVVWVRC